MAPIVLPSNQPPDRFYQGGKQISKFRSEATSGPRQPEDWVASTTCCSGHDSLGLSRLPDGSLLIDEIQKHPPEWLGPDHIKAYGIDTKLLVKLLDAGQRLPVHAHPHADWSKENIGHAHGKAEAWYILTPGKVFLGLRESISAAEMLKLVEAQDIHTLLGMMHKVPVKAHQTVYVPPGLLHAIGEGILLVEVQEPEDLSILLEWRDFDIDGSVHGHLGVGFQKALTAVEIEGRSREQVLRLVSDQNSFGNVVAAESNEYFVIERLQFEGEISCRRGFAIVVVLDGDMQLITDSKESVSLTKGTTTVVPFADGDFLLQGTGQLLVARPPSPA